MKVIEQIVRLTINGDETKAEVVGELVRCNDCKRHECYIRSRLMDGSEYESDECRKFNMAVTPEWFCADGKRKETEDASRT